MGILRISQRVPRLCLAAGTLCLAVAAITQSWAEEPVVDAPATSMEENTVVAEVFSTGSLQQLDDGQLRLLLNVAGGNLVDGQGVERAEDQGDHVTFAIDLSQGESHLQSHNSEGGYGRLHVRQMTASVHDLLPHPESPDMMNEWILGDDIYTAMRLFMIYLNSQKSSGTLAELEMDFMVRDFLLQASHSVIIRRTNGDLDITLYRQDLNDGALIPMGEITVDPYMRYQLKGNISDSSYQSQWKATITELMNLQKRVNEIRREIARLADDDETGIELKQEQQEREKQFSELYKEVGMAHELTWYGITETVDYGAQSWLKIADADNGGIHAAALGVNYKVMSSLIEAKAAEDIHRMGLLDLLSYVRTLLDQTREGNGRVQGEETHSYLSRQLATVWAALNARLTSDVYGGYELPAQYLANNELTVPVMRIKNTSHFVTSGTTLKDTLDQITTALPAQTDNIRPDKIVVSEHQFHQMKESLNRSGWGAWLKSFFFSDAYETSTESSQLRTLLNQNQAGLTDLVTTGIEGGVPVRVVAPGQRTGKIVFANQRVLPEFLEAAEQELIKDAPHILVLKDPGGERTVSAERLTNARKQQIEQARIKNEIDKMEMLAEAKINHQMPEHQGTLRKIGNQAMGTLAAAGTGMATGYIVQRGIDATSKYYNEGITPWRANIKESDAQHERAVKTGSIMAANAAVSHLVLPHVASNNGYFEGLSGMALRNRALKGKYEASVAGGIAGAVTQSAMAGYQYWQGNISAGELATDIADAAGRSLFTTAGSMGGHALMPYSFDVPYVSNLLPIGNVGAVMGSVAGNIAYDTVKHYTSAGVERFSNYYNSAEPTTE